MNKKRLLKLADLLEADSKNKKGIRFDMFGWGYIKDQKNPMSCGTEVCAMGLAALSGAFKRAGLGASISRAGVLSFKWKGRRIDGLPAAERLFGINKIESNRLFIPRREPNTGSTGEKAKARQIRNFVKSGQL